MTTTVWIAEYELGRYDMRAYGTTADEAHGALIRAVNHHVKTTGADPQHVTWALEEGQPFEAVLGVGYRDGLPCGPHAALGAPDYSAVTDRQFNRSTNNGSLYG
jgi:hypothetical protein